MKRIFLLALGLMALSHIDSAWAAGRLNVVATLPDLGAVVSEIGGDKISLTVLARPTEDPHFVEAKPSFIRVLNQADLLVEGGAELEIGWLPRLVDNARNPKIVRGGTGRIDGSKGMRLLDIPTGPIDRSQGDVHPAGNPHYLLDPNNGGLLAEQVTQKLIELDPANHMTFANNLTRFKEKLRTKTREWTAQAEKLKGVPVVTYHKTYDYLAAFLGFQIVGQVESKPGIEPSPTYLKELIPQMKSKQVKLLLMEPNRNRKVADTVAAATGAKVFVLPAMPSAPPFGKGYLEHFDQVMAILGKIEK